MAIVRNTTLQTIMLDDGTIIGTAGHDGSEKDVTLSTSDRTRFVDTEKLRVLPVRQKEAASITPSPSPVLPATREELSSNSASPSSTASAQHRSPGGKK